MVLENPGKFLNLKNFLALKVFEDLSIFEIFQFFSPEIYLKSFLKILETSLNFVSN